jgi:RNA polymerase-binding transcription factor DksA
MRAWTHFTRRSSESATNMPHRRPGTEVRLVDDVIVRQRLESMLSDLDRSIRTLRDDPPAERSLADAGADLTEADRLRAMLDVATRQRSAVLGALKRLDDGTYGRCVDCGRPVPEGRLEARPEADRCVPCQAKAERRRH